MTAPTLAEFRAFLDEYGFACQWSPLTQERSAALYARLFPPSLPYGQHIQRDPMAGYLDARPLDEFPEPHMKRPEWLADIIADAIQHDRDHGILPPGGAQ